MLMLLKRQTIIPLGLRRLTLLFTFSRATAMCVVSVGFSSFFNGLVVFTILGFMAKQSGLPVDEVAKASGRVKAFVIR